MGAGFVERYLNGNKQSMPPEFLGYVVQKECLQETKYHQKKDFYMDGAKAIAVIFGSNHDTTVGFHLPLFASSKEIELNGDEYSDLMLLPTKKIDDFLNEGGYKDIKATDHVLGCLEAYRENYLK